MFRDRHGLFIASFLCLAGMHQGLGQGSDRQQPRLILNALDADLDGKLSAAEIKDAHAQLLKLDRNGDGQLTIDELTPRPENAGAAPGELVAQLMSFDKTGKGYLVSGDLPERMQGLFRRADADHDGKLTPEEIRTLSSHQGMPMGAASAPGSAPASFRLDPLLEALDTNHDGVISADEIAAANLALLTLDKNGDGELTADEIRMRQQTAEDRAGHMLEEWDTNHDGKVSRAETPERMVQQFDSIDKNGDGFLSKEELVEYFKAQSAQPRGPRDAGGAKPTN